MRASFTLALFSSLLCSAVYADEEPEAPALGEDHEADPATVPGEEHAAPTPAPAPLDEEEPLVPLLERAAADEAWARCFADATPAARPALRACLEEVMQRHAGTPGAFRAEGSLRALPLLEMEAPPVASEGFQIPPGRLELSSTAGLFGIWTGVATGISIFAHLPGRDPAPAILGTGLLALGLGIGAGFGGYYLADGFDMGEGDARLVSSGLVWGTTFGIATLPALFELGLSDGFTVSVPLIAIVAAGLAGGGAAFGVTRFAKLSSAEVSLINTGGWVFALFGLLAMPNLAAFQVQSPPAYSATYIAIGSLGLGLGALASQVLDLSWGETLLLDLGAVLGIVASATVVFSLNAGGAFRALPGAVAVPLNTGLIGLGAVGGLAATGLGIGILRGSERPLFRVAGLELEPALGVPTVVLDTARQPVLIVPGPALRFSL